MARGRTAKHRTTCLYCGGESLTKEHIVPKALGGGLALKLACEECNNGVLSSLDRELACRSPLSIVAERELDRRGGRVWDYSEQDDFALEARYDPKCDASRLWPQLVFAPEMVTFRYDLEEGREVGEEQYLRRFLDCLRGARRTLDDCTAERRLVWEKIAEPPRRGRFPPRVFTPHTYSGISGRTTFVCRYTGQLDKAALLQKLDEWDPFSGGLAKRQELGVYDPEVHDRYEPLSVQRALVKIGLSVLAYACEHTFVTKDAFRYAVDFVRGDSGCGVPKPGIGFVWQSDIQLLRCPERAHRFRLGHQPGFWSAVYAFFGGRVGAVAVFPGPSHEKWRWVDVTAPVGSNKWVIDPHTIILPRITVHEEWCDLSKVIPTVPMANLQTRTVYDAPGEAGS